MLEAEYVFRVRELGRERGLTLDVGDIRDSLFLALQAVSGQIAQASDYILGQYQFTVPIVAGVASLASFPDLMSDHIETVRHPDIDGAGTQQYFSRIPNGTRADLASAKNTMFPPFVVEANTIYCSLGNGIWPDPGDKPPDANLEVLANRIQTLLTLPSQYEDDLIGQGLSFAMGKAAA